MFSQHQTHTIESNISNQPVFLQSANIKENKEYMRRSDEVYYFTDLRHLLKNKWKMIYEPTKRSMKVQEASIGLEETLQSPNP